MRTATALLATTLALTGCTGTAPTDETQQAQNCQYYSPLLGGCPPPKPPPIGIVDTPIPLRCPDGRDAALPYPRELKNVNLATLWNGHHGVLVSYFTPETEAGDADRVQIYGVDLADHLVVFSIFAPTFEAPPAFTLQNETLSDPQHPNCPGDHNVDQGMASAGKAPGDPPPTSGGPICPDGPCFCTVDYIMINAAGRACQ